MNVCKAYTPLKANIHSLTTGMPCNNSVTTPSKTRNFFSFWAVRDKREPITACFRFLPRMPQPRLHLSCDAKRCHAIKFGLIAEIVNSDFSTLSTETAEILKSWPKYWQMKKPQTRMNYIYLLLPSHLARGSQIAARNPQINKLFWKNKKLNNPSVNPHITLVWQLKSITVQQ